MQREELQLQRVAAQQQALELNNAAKLGSLEQIRALLEDAEKAVRDSKVGVSSNLEIQNVLLREIKIFNLIDSSTDPNRISELYTGWLPYEALAKNYLRYVSSALNIYIIYHLPDANVDSNAEPAEFIIANSSWGNNAPFLSHHIGVATALAHFLSMLGPAMERMRLAWMVAAVKSFDQDMFARGALDSLRDKVLQYSNDLPNICTPWPK